MKNQILKTTSQNQLFLHLSKMLDQDLNSRYGIVQDSYNQYNKIPITTKAIIITTAGEPVACGAFKEEADHIEIKRMFVHPLHRGKGLSKIVLQNIESWAKDLRYATARLETGIKQPEAISLYQKTGYKRIPAFGPYLHMSDSLCFEKILNPIANPCHIA